MTAEEIMSKSGIPLPQEPDNVTVNVLQIKHAMIEFAKYHVEKALNSANETATLMYEGERIGQECDDMYIEDITVENTYPLTNIK